MARVGTSTVERHDDSYAGVSVREEYEAKFRKSLVERAKKRLDDIEQPDLFNLSWRVTGRTKLGDAHNSYWVALKDDGKYRCSCYDTNHGRSRARRMCSHVLAVILWRKDNSSQHRGSVEGPDNDEPTARLVGTGPEPLDPRDPSLTPRSWEPPPEWLTAYRSHQWRAAVEIVDAFNNGARVVYCDAPPGTGKTLLADLVARLLRVRATYVCTSKQLQDQILHDLPYARILKGRSNYPTLQGPKDVTAEDCDGTTPDQNDCTFCDPMNQCPYRVAKQIAIRAQMSVLNTAYWLREANYVHGFSRAKWDHGTMVEPAPPDEGLVIIDECDTLESLLLGFIEFGVTPTRLRQLGLKPPPPKSHYTTIAKWLRDEFQKAIIYEVQRLPDNVPGRRRARGLSDLALEGLRVAREIDAEHSDDDTAALEGEGVGWVRDNNSGPLTMKPISVAQYGPDKVWAHAGRILMMSGTIVSADELQGSLGQHEDAAVVRVPMTVPVENRPIHVAPVANVTKGNQEKAWPALAKAVIKIAERHPGESILVHTVAYKLAEYLTRKCNGALYAQGRKTVTYTKAADRMGALEAFRSHPGSVLFAPSFDRGVDLPEDDCRVIIVAKCPFPYLGDAQVNARMRSRDGQAWYVAQTIRSIVQMTGRAVRSETDRATSYILDAQFTRNLYKKNRALFPDWWRDALDTSFRVRELL